MLQKNLNEVEEDLLDPDDINNKLTELENRSRRNDLHIDSIAETSKNYWENCEEQFQKTTKEKLEIEKTMRLIDVTEQGKKTV